MATPSRTITNKTNLNIFEKTKRRNYHGMLQRVIQGLRGSSMPHCFLFASTAFFLARFMGSLDAGGFSTDLFEDAGLESLDDAGFSVALSEDAVLEAAGFSTGLPGDTVFEGADSSLAFSMLVIP